MPILYILEKTCRIHYKVTSLVYNRIQMVWTHGDFRRRGLARKLLTEFIASRSEGDVVELMALPAPDMELADLVKFYESLGFEVDPASDPDAPTMLLTCHK